MRKFSGEVFLSIRFQLLVTVMLAWLIPTAVFSRFLFSVLPDYRRMTENALTTSAEFALSQMTEKPSSMEELEEAVQENTEQNWAGLWFKPSKYGRMV